MSKLIMATYTHGININYKCKSLYVKYKGRKCKDFASDACMSCDFCIAQLPAKEVTRLLKNKT